MNIKAVGPSLLDELLQDQTLYKMLKYYPWALLDPEEFGILEKIRSIWGDAYTNQYLNSLEELSGNRNAAHFIAALGYPGLGYKTAMKALQMLKDQKMKSQITTDAAVNFVRAYTTYKLALNDLRNFEFASIPSQSVATYCITGTLSMHRNDMIAWLNKYNWQFVNTVTRHTNYLIVGENNKETVKEKRAKQLRVTIIYEHQLPQLLKETSDERRNDEVDSGDRS
jgi:NAD-dependent DNA ligase